MQLPTSLKHLTYFVKTTNLKQTIYKATQQQYLTYVILRQGILHVVNMELTFGDDVL